MFVRGGRVNDHRVDVHRKSMRPGRPRRGRWSGPSAQPVRGSTRGGGEQPVQRQRVFERWCHRQHRGVVEDPELDLRRQPHDRQRGEPTASRTPGGGNGGAIYLDGNEMTLELVGSVVRGNVAREGGGAVFFVSNDRSGRATIDRSLLTGNPEPRFRDEGLPGDLPSRRRPAVGDRLDARLIQSDPVMPLDLGTQRCEVLRVEVIAQSLATVRAASWCRGSGRTGPGSRPRSLRCRRSDRS